MLVDSHYNVLTMNVATQTTNVAGNYREDEGDDSSDSDDNDDGGDDVCRNTLYNSPSKQGVRNRYTLSWQHSM